MKNLIFLLLVILGILLSACAPTVSASAPPPPANVAPEGEKYYCTTPETDNGKTWFNANICYDTQVYHLTVRIIGDLNSNQTTNGSISGSSYNGYGSVSGRIWTEGKGILPVQIISMSPVADQSWGNWIDLSLPYILKTSDLGIMGVPVNATVEVVCNHDVEALSPVFNGQTFTKDRVTHELDNCRLVTKNYTIQ